MVRTWWRRKPKAAEVEVEVPELSLDELLACGYGRRIRRSAGVSQRHLAALVLSSRSTVGRWERGEAAPAGPKAELYVKTLNELRRSVLDRAARFARPVR